VAFKIKRKLTLLTYIAKWNDHCSYIKVVIKTLIIVPCMPRAPRAGVLVTYFTLLSFFLCLILSAYYS